MADVLSTGLLKLDKILSGEGALRRDELGVTAVRIDYEMAKPPDRPIKV